MPKGEYCCFAVDTGNHDSGSIFVRYDTGLHAVYSQNFVARKGSGRRGVRIIGYNTTLEFEFNSQTMDIFYHNENKNEPNHERLEESKKGKTKNNRLCIYQYAYQKEHYPNIMLVWPCWYW